MSGRISVRALEPGDIPAFNRVHNQPGVVREISQPPYISVAERREAIQSSATQREIVAEIDGEVVGFGSLELGTRRLAHSGRIGMAVDERYWGRGIGAALMRALLDLADNWYNLRRVQLHVYSDNQRAIALYQRFGFEVEATHRASHFRDGNWADIYTMARLRNEPGITGVAR